MIKPLLFFNEGGTHVKLIEVEDWTVAVKFSGLFGTEKLVAHNQYYTTDLYFCTSFFGIE